MVLKSAGTKEYVMKSPLVTCCPPSALLRGHQSVSGLPSFPASVSFYPRAQCYPVTFCHDGNDRIQHSSPQALMVSIAEELTFQLNSLIEI